MFNTFHTGLSEISQVFEIQKLIVLRYNAFIYLFRLVSGKKDFGFLLTSSFDNKKLYLLKS